MAFFDVSKTDPALLAGEVDHKESYLCVTCRTALTTREALLPVGGSAFHIFTNPAGFQYNLLTFSECRMYREACPPVSQESWFPGYCWIIIHCARCESLLGWKFVADSGSPDQAPFFGLIREQIVLGE